MKFRKKPVVIEAVQWRGDNVDEVFGISAVPEVDRSFVHNPIKKVFEIDTLEGKMLANVGDWIIRGVKGELYPCKPDIFEATYEPAETNNE